MNSTRPLRHPLALSLLLLPALACGTAEEATPEPGGGAPTESAPGSATDETSDGLPRFVGQEGWVSETPGNMRMLQFRLAAAEGEDDIEVAIASWPTGVGGLEANLDRWVGQVGLTGSAANLSSEQRWTEDVRGFTVTTVYLKGKVATMQDADGHAAASPDGSLIAAYIEILGKPQVWTVKVTGGSASVEKHKASVLAFLQGL